MLSKKPKGASLRPRKINGVEAMILVGHSKMVLPIDGVEANAPMFPNTLPPRKCGVSIDFLSIGYLESIS